MRGGGVAGVLALAVLSGCAARDSVTRVVNGRAVEGDYVPPEAYAAHLRGAIAEASGRLDEAVAAFEEAAAFGPADPEPWTRAGLARCERDPRDPEAEAALGRALAIDEAYAPAWEARARCAAARGGEADAAAHALRAVESDPRSTGALAILARSDAAEVTRDRLLAMTLEAPTDGAAWRALATWGELHGDAVLEARALSRVVALEGAARARVAEAVRRLAGEGAVAEARVLAHAEANAGRASDPRLAVDDAIVMGDADEVLRVCARAHVPRGVAAARAVMLGEPALARSLARPVVLADPGAMDARMALAAAADLTGDRGGEAEALRGAAAGEGGLALEPWLVYARLLVRRGSIDAARATVPLLARTLPPWADVDPSATPAVVALVAQGVLPARDLGPNAHVELAERRGEPVDPAVAARADPRHRLLALARIAPASAETLELARRLSPFRARDALVAVAYARLALAGVPGTPRVDDALARLDPADPLVAAAVYDLALHAKDARGLPLARARLAAVAHTPAEMARLH